jgi:C1A family cysteine protease
MNGNIIEMNVYYKKKIFIILLFVSLVLSISFVSALSNPASVYCKEIAKEYSDYSYKIKTNSDGSQYGVCIIDGKEYEEWNFFKGKIGQDYSYCKKLGYDSKTISDKNGEYAVCFKGNLKKVSGGEKFVSEEIKVDELMNLSSKLRDKRELTNKKAITTSELKDSSLSLNLNLDSKTIVYNQTNFNYWDWRTPPNSTKWGSANYTYFDINNGFITSIKDQGSCGSCWAFSSIAGIEAKYEINKNESRLNPDLSEQYFVSCDFSSYLGESQAGCGGGWMDIALKYAKESGITDNSCLPYADLSGCSTSCSGCTYTVGENCSNLLCNQKCSDASTRMWNITDYTTTYQGGATILQLTNNETKQYLIENGPMVTGIYMETSNDPGTGIYRCTDDAHISNHGVLLVGYNDTGSDSTSYWIFKNSWGTSWGMSGYFKVGFNECNVTSEFEFPSVVNSPTNYAPSIIITSPTNTTYYQIDTTFNFTVKTKNSTTATCDLKLNGIINQTNTSVTNNTETIFSLNLSSGSNNYSIICWENNLGIINESSNIQFSVVLDVVAPFINFSIPTTQEGSYNISNIWANVSVNDTGSNIDTLKIYIYDYDSGITINSSINKTINSQTATVFVNFTNVPDGSYILNVTVNDSLGNINSTQILNIIINKNSPVITINSPANNSWNNGIYFNVSVNEESNCWAEFNNTNITLEGKSGITESKYYEDLTIAESSNNNSYNVTYYCNDSLNNLNKSNIIFFGIDKTPPEIVLSSPDDSTSSTTTAYNFTFNVSDNNSILQCSLVFNNVIIHTIYSISKTATNGMYNSSLSTGTHLWSINCTDSAGNQNKSINRILIITSSGNTETSSSPSGGGGGGGGGATTYSPTTSETYLGYTKQLSSNDKISFTSNSENHLLILKSVIGNYSNITIESNPINFILFIGQEKKVDVNNDSYYDLNVKLNTIKGSVANLTIKNLNEYYGNLSGNKVITKDENITQNNESNTNEVKTEENLVLGYVVLGIGAFVIILVVIKIINKFKRKRRFNIPKKFKYIKR